MRHLAAYLLLTVGGNTKPTIEDVSNVLAQAGIETDSERLAALFAELQGKDVNELIALGKEKLMVGGAMAASASAPAAASAEGETHHIFYIYNHCALTNKSQYSFPIAAAPAAKAAAKPVEEEVDALDGGMDMFGGGGAKTGDY